jgi:hypothetical protein
MRNTMPKYAEPPSSQELRDAIRRILDRSGLSEAEAGRRLGFAAPSQLNRRLNDGKPPFSREEIERICRVFALDDEQRIELLRLRGDVVIAQQGQAPQVVAVDQLQSVLAGLIGQSLKAELSALPALIAEAARGIIPWEILRERISRASQIDVGDVSGTGIAIGDGAQSHVITIESLQVWLPPPPPPPDPLALLEAMPVEDEAPVPPADQSALGLVPHRIDLLPNEQFIGRDRELRALARQLKAGRNVVVTTGMGGIGKTQLASEFAYRYGRYFAGGVFWIDCSIPERVPASVDLRQLRGRKAAARPPPRSRRLPRPRHQPPPAVERRPEPDPAGPGDARAALQHRAPPEARKSLPIRADQERTGQRHR